MDRPDPRHEACDPFRRGDAAWLAGVLLAAAVVFWPSLAGELVFDDLLLVGRNPQLADLASLPRLFTASWWEFADPTGAKAVGYWRPLPAVVHAIAWQLGQGSALAFRAASLLTHLLAVVAAFLLARRLTRSTQVAGGAALLFALHPAQVESAVWISALNTPLFGLFALLALLAFLRWRDAGSSGVPWAAGALLLVALLAKELAVIAVPMALALDLGRRDAPGEERGALSLPAWPRAYAPFAAALLAYFGARALVFGSALGGVEREPIDFGVGTVRLLGLRLEVLGGSLQLLALPLEPSLFRRFRPEIGPTDPALVRALLATLAALAVLVWVAWRRLRPELAACLIVPACLLPMLVPVQSLGRFPLADRFLYLPVLGLALLVAGLLHRRLSARPATAVLLVIAALCAVRSHARVEAWQDEEAMFRTAAEQAPRSPYVHRILGRVLLARHRETGDWAYLEEAQRAYERAGELVAEAGEPGSDVLAVTSDGFQVRLGLGWCRLFASTAGDPEGLGDAIAAFEDLAREGTLAGREELEVDQFYVALGVAYRLAGRHEEAGAALTTALERNPRSAEAHLSLGRLLFEAGRVADAQRHVEDALALQPEHFETQLILTQILDTAGEAERAEALARELLERSPDTPEPMLVLAAADLRRGAPADALEWLDRALAADPELGHAWRLRANALVMLGRNDARTLEAFRRAAELSPRDFEARYELGAWLLRIGDMEGAVPHLVGAYRLAPEQYRASLADALAGLPVEDPWPYFELATIDAQRGAFGAAEAWLDQALARDPDHSDSIFQKGRVLRRMGRHEEALALMRRSCELSPESFLAFSELGGYLAELGDADGARAALENALELGPPAEWEPGMAEAARVQVRELLAQLPAPGG